MTGNAPEFDGLIFAAAGQSLSRRRKAQRSDDGAVVGHRGEGPGHVRGVPELDCVRITARGELGSIRRDGNRADAAAVLWAGLNSPAGLRFPKGDRFVATAADQSVARRRKGKRADSPFVSRKD